MQSRGPLMIEHRLIERMLETIKALLEDIESRHAVDPVRIDTIVDFIRTYADRTHHGKEEDILFRELQDRSLSVDDRRIMEELIEEHRIGRRTTQAVVDANRRYRGGDDNALEDIAEGLRSLVDFYPRHIEKEDKLFFPSSRAYFTDAEDQALLVRYREFDEKMIHEKYEAVVRQLAASEDPNHSV